MTTSPAGIDLIKKWESCRFTAYKDTKGVWTIGWGHTRDVKQGDVCTQAQADQWFVEDLAELVDDELAKLLPPCSQNEYDALASFVFNFGGPKLRTSTLLRKFIAGKKAAATAQFSRWVYTQDEKTKKMIIEDGLVKRRQDEAILFAGDD